MWKSPSDAAWNRCQTNTSLTRESARKSYPKHRFRSPSCCTNAAQHDLFPIRLRVNCIRKVVHRRPPKRKAPPPDQRVAVHVHTRPGQDRSVRGLEGCGKGEGSESKIKGNTRFSRKLLSAHRNLWRLPPWSWRQATHCPRRAGQKWRKSALLAVFTARSAWSIHLSAWGMLAIRQRAWRLARKTWNSAKRRGSASLSRAMKLVRHNIRLPASLDNALRSLAKHQGTSAYAVLQQCVQAGIAALAHAPAAGTRRRRLPEPAASDQNAPFNAKGADGGFCRNLPLSRRSSTRWLRAFISVVRWTKRRPYPDRRRRFSAATAASSIRIVASGTRFVP